MRILNQILVSAFLLLVVCCTGICSSECYGYTANKVRLKAEKYHYRIYVVYTDVELLKLKEAYIDFKNLKEAQECYQKLYSGGDFYVKDSQVVFTNNLEPTPW